MMTAAAEIAPLRAHHESRRTGEHGRFRRSPIHSRDAARVLARSFRDEPNFVDLFPEEPARVRALPYVFGALLRDAVVHGHVHAATQDGDVVGVAVWPSAHGRGIGTALLRPGLAQADRAGLPCYRETHRHRNVAWYRKLGFEVSAETASPAGGPKAWTMLRHGSGR